MLSHDYIRFQHMLDASEAAILHMKGKRKENLDNNRLLLNGIIRELEILGEAASRISQLN